MDPSITFDLLMSNMRKYFYFDIKHIYYQIPLSIDTFLFWFFGKEKEFLLSSVTITIIK